MENGFAVVRRTWKNGDIVELELPMPVRRTSCDPRVRENAGMTAVTRGPLVICRERPADAGVRTPAEITLIPYYAWNNRGDDQTMRVWLPDLSGNPNAGMRGD